MFHITRPPRERGESAKKYLRVLVAGESTVTLGAVCSYLENLGPITVVSTARTGYELLQLAERLEPDLVVTDLRMPRISGLECALYLKDLLPATRVIVLTDFEGSFVRNACLESGADACLHTSRVPEELVLAIRRLFPRVIESS